MQTTEDNGVGESNAEPSDTTSTAPAPDFVTETSTKLDAAFAAMDRGETPPAPTAPAPVAPSTKEGSGLPSDNLTPPADRLNPLEPDSDEALDREIAQRAGNMGKKERDAFSKLRYEARDYKRAAKEVPALRDKLAELEAGTKANPALEAKIQAYESKIADYESRLASSDVERTDAWSSQVAAPIREIDALVDRLATKYSADPAAMRSALRTVGDTRSDEIAVASSEMNEFDRSLFFQAAHLHDAVVATAQGMRENASGTLSRLSAAQQEAQGRADQAAKAEWDSATPRAWDRVAEMAPVLQESEGADDWNAAIGKAKTFANTVKYSDLGVTEQAEVLHRAAVFPLINSMVRALENEVSVLRTANSKFRGASPAAGGSSTAPAGAGRQTDFGNDLGFMDAVDRKFREAGIA